MKDKNLGSIFFDKSKNKWVACYYVYDNITQQKKRLKKRFNSEFEANEFLSNPQTNEYTLNEVLEQVLNLKVQTQKISDKQYSILKGINNVISQQKFSNKIINTINENEISAFLNTLLNYSDNYIKKFHNHLNTAFIFAATKGYLTNNPMSRLIRPRSLKIVKKVRSLTEEEQFYLNKHLMTSNIFDLPYKNVYLLMLHMGLRIGETLALKLNDIDLITNTITINKIVVTDKSNKPILVEQYENSRIVNINKEILNSIKQQLNIAKSTPENFLFLSRNYTLAIPSTINKGLQKIMNSIGSENIQTQSLRYTYRDNCLKNGLTPNEIIKLIGPINFE